MAPCKAMRFMHHLWCPPGPPFTTHSLPSNKGSIHMNVSLFLSAEVTFFNSNVSIWTDKDRLVVTNSTLAGQMLLWVVHFYFWYDRISLTTHGKSVYLMTSTQNRNRKKAFENNRRTFSKLRYWVVTLRGQFFFPIQLSLHIDLFYS